jgi:hypothetical protein
VDAAAAGLLGAFGGSILTGAIAFGVAARQRAWDQEAAERQRDWDRRAAKHHALLNAVSRLWANGCELLSMGSAIRRLFKEGGHGDQVEQLILRLSPLMTEITMASTEIRLRSDSEASQNLADEVTDAAYGVVDGAGGVNPGALGPRLEELATKLESLRVHERSMADERFCGRS